MARLTSMSGVSQVVGRMKTSVVKTGVGIGVNLKRAGLFVQRISQEVVPVDKAVLKNSARTKNEGGTGFDTDIVVSYNTDYAPHVHENLDARHKEGKQAKFIEGPVRIRKDEILAKVAGR